MLASQILIGLAGLGHQVRTVAPITDTRRSAIDIFAVNHRELEMTWYRVPYTEMDTFVPGDPEYQREEGEQIRGLLSSLIDGERPDVILIGRDNFAWHVPDMAIEYSIPSVLLVQGGTTTGILDQAYPDDVARNFLQQCRKTTLVVTVAHHWARSLRELGIEGVRVVPNPVDLDRFFPGPKDKRLLHELDIGESETVVLHASNLKRVKRPMDIVESAEGTLQRYPKLVYVVVGDGELRELMEESCQQKGVLDRFRFVGWIEHERMPAYMRLADIVLMPSESEVQALVYLEAQACRCALIASDIPGAREVIVDGETGVLFRVGSIEELTEKTVLLAGDPAMRANIAQRARKAVDSHSLDRIVRLYDAILTEVAERRSC